MKAPMDAQILDTLVRKAKAGDAEAYGRVVKATHRTVLAVAFSTTRDWAASEDLAQETFLTAWSALNSLRKERQFRIWLLRIARNLSLNWVRSEKYRRQLAERYSATHAESHSPPQEQEMVMEDRRRQLATALERLAPPVREVVVLYYLEGAESRDIANTLGISPAAVRKRLERGREAIRSELEKQWAAETADELSGKDSALARRIVGSIGLPPLAQSINAGAAGNGISALVHHVQHNGLMASLKPLLTGGIVMTTKQAIGAALVAAILILGAYTLFGRPTADETASPDIARVTADGSVTPAPAASESVGEEPRATSDADMESPRQTAETTNETNARRTVAVGRDSEQSDEEPSKDVVPASIAGVVVDQWDRPVADAEITVVATGIENVDRNARNEFLRAQVDRGRHYHATSDRSGEFRVDGIESFGITELHARVEGGYIDHHLVLQEGMEADGIILRLSMGTPLRGRLLGTRGQPIAGAIMNSLAFITEDSAQGGNDGWAYTDDQGYFELVFEEPGYATVKAAEPERGEAVFQAVAVGTDEAVDLIWGDPGALTGTLTWQDGRPAEDVQVVLESTYTLSSMDVYGNANVSAGTSGPTLYGRTGSDGTYLVEKVPAGLPYEVYAADADGNPLCLTESLGVFEPAETKQWDRVLGAVTLLTGEVRGVPSGQPAADVTVVCLDPETGDEQVRTRTGTDGYFELELPVMDGNFILLANHRFLPMEHRNRAFDTPLTLPRNPDEELLLSVDDPFSVAFFVVDPSGTPIENASVAPQWHYQNGTTGWGGVGTTDADGRFEWGGAAPYGAYTFRVSGPNHTARESQLYEGAPGDVYPPETIVLYKVAGIEGVAVDAAGQPIANTTITVASYIGGERVSTAFSRTDGQGYFYMPEGVPAAAASVELIVSSPRRTQRIENIQFYSDQIVDVGVVRLETDP